MHLGPDNHIIYQNGFFKFNLTIVTTWALMLLLTIGSKVITRNFSAGLNRSHWQNLLEIIVTSLEQQIKEIGLQQPQRYLGFLGTLFLFIAISNCCIIIPGYEPPTSSLSTTTALALCVFIAVPFYGIREEGLARYLNSFLQPTAIMLPFNIIGEISRTLALAVRLFGNIMSGTLIVAILLTVAPFVFPIVMTLLGLLTGMVQAYIFSVLATVYIAASTQGRKAEQRSRK
jgi:F-type H+-transporting ATPase subunit a